MVTACSSMLPLLAQPSLILAESFRPGGQANLESLLAPDEAVKATVLNVQDDGSLLLRLNDRSGLRRRMGASACAWLAGCFSRASCSFPAVSVRWP